MILTQTPTLADFGQDVWWIVLIKILGAFVFGLFALVRRLAGPLLEGAPPLAGRILESARLGSLLTLLVVPALYRWFSDPPLQAESAEPAPAEHRTTSVPSHSTT